MSLNQGICLDPALHGHVAVDSSTSDHSVFGEELMSAQRMM